MKARIIEPRFVCGNELSKDMTYKYLHDTAGLSHEDIDKHIQILCDYGLVRSSESGFTVLAPAAILKSL